MAKIKVYEYEGCSTCRKALAYLEKRKVEFQKLPIVDQPPSPAELKAMLKAKGELKKLFNISGLLYREMKIGDKLQTMSEDEALALLAKHGKLVKRPFVLGPGVALLGFQEAEWAKAFA